MLAYEVLKTSLDRRWGARGAFQKRQQSRRPSGLRGQERLHVRDRMGNRASRCEELGRQR